MNLIKSAFLIQNLGLLGALILAKAVHLQILVY